MIEIIHFLMILIGLCSSLVGSLLGVGGGFINVPSLIFFGYPEYSTAISLFAIIFNGLTASIFNFRKELIDFKIAALFIPSAVLGGICGVFVFNFIVSIDINIFKLIFTFFLVILGIKIYFKKDNGEEEEKIVKVGELNKRLAALAIFIGFAIGFFGSFLGIGGGTISVPTFILMFGLSTHVAIATSLFLMIFTSFSGLITYFFEGNLPDFAILFGFLLVIGVLIGANIGSRLAYKLKGKKIRKIYGIIMVCVAIPLTWIRIFVQIDDPFQIFIKNLINFFSNFSL
ncbi:MAG: sulfite exporter TauE/SafE family protein [Candidatus Helarchaeota archaeon]